MKNITLFSSVTFLMIAATNSSAQVGLNTTAPKTTMDISAKRDASGNIVDNNQLIGLQAPRLTLAELTANTAIYGSDQKGALIYITNISGGDTSSPRTNINAVGYYYFDGSLWQKVSGNVAADSTDDAWINDGANAMVKLGTKSDGTARASGTEFVALDNGNVGVGISSPTEKLDNEGTTRLRTLPLNGTTNAIYTTPSGMASTTQNQTFTATGVVVADGNGVLGYIEGLPQTVTSTSGSTVVKVIYTGTNADPNKIVKIGDLVFRINNTSGAWDPQMALTSAVAKTVYVGMNQQYASNGFEYNNYTKTYTVANATDFQNISTTGSANKIVNTELNIFHIVDIDTNAYYRITFYISGPASGSKTFVIAAERF